MGNSRKIWTVACGALLWATVGCAHYGGADRGLADELRATKQQAELERTRVLELEARLAWLEQKTREFDQHAAATRDQRMLLDKLDTLIALNQRLLSEHATPLTSPPAQIIQSSEQPSSLASAAAPECNVGLSTEEKIRQLVLRLRGERSPWRVDGLSYEESEALRFLLRRERQLDAKNPWQ